MSTSLTLLDQVQGDDPQAWKVFTGLYGPLVYTWCRNLGLPPSDVEDVCQEIFCVVSTKLATFEPERKTSGAFRSWLWGITRYEVLKYVRSTKRQPIGRGGHEHEAFISRLESEPNEPESIDGATAQQVLFRSAIDLLKPEFDAKTWQAFWDLGVKGRPAKEIGDELAMTAKAVRQAKFRVSKKLRDLLADDFPGSQKTANGD